MKINPSSGVMTADHEKLVYAATFGNSTKGVDSDADLTEPWINADCSTLYFRHDNQTWMASVVDASGTPP